MKGTPLVYLPSADPKAAARWYVSKLGFRLGHHEPYASVVRDGAVTLRLVLSEEEPAPYAVAGWEVRDVRRAMKDLRAKRVKLWRDPGRPQDEEGVWTSPFGEKVAWFRDRDGNVLSLTQPPR